MTISHSFSHIVEKPRPRALTPACQREPHSRAEDRFERDEPATDIHGDALFVGQNIMVFREAILGTRIARRSGVCTPNRIYKTNIYTHGTNGEQAMSTAVSINCTTTTPSLVGRVHCTGPSTLLGHKLGVLSSLQELLIELPFLHYSQQQQPQTFYLGSQKIGHPVPHCMESVNRMAQISSPLPRKKNPSVESIEHEKFPLLYLESILFVLTVSV